MSEDRERIASNDNEDVADDDDVEAHAFASSNANEDAADDDQVRGRLAANDNEDVAEDD